ncbi:sigma-70 family RNA polymerase sigma factor [Kitasatospora sp. NPDC002227]|uniref:BACON domain-containing protein n=1 Tax=Kitasatospora sp. NPDC002227 TaxID=3154773 RepID=UPI00332A96B8
MTTRLAPQESPTSRAPQEPPGSAALQGYDHHVDGLFTYCLSVLCEHEAAAGAVREVRALVLRHGERLADPALLRAWLYALARHCCLRRLGAARAATAPGARSTPAGSSSTVPAGTVSAEERQRELRSLAWPEAAGTSPEQREALELAVRHRLRPAEVAAVLGLSGEAAGQLLAAAGAEVGRTRSALLVLGVGHCPVLAELGGVGAESWRGWVLGPALRRELVRHVAACPTCRGTAERVADGAADFADLSGLSGLPVLPAPVTLRLAATAAEGGSGYDAAALPAMARESAGAAFHAGAAAGRLAAGRHGRPPGGERTGAPAPERPRPGRRRAPGAVAGEPVEVRFDPQGFPRHRAPGRALRPGPVVRQRVVTTGVLAAVLTAPVVALWVAHRGGAAASTISSVRVDSVGSRPVAGHPSAAAGAGPAERPGVLPMQLAAAPAETLLPPARAAALHAGPGAPAGMPDVPGAPGAPAGPGAPATSAGQLVVEANDYAGRTVLTLTNTGGSALDWHTVTDAPWLRLSRDSGTLEPGQRITVTVTVDDATAPQHQWTAHLTFPPAASVVTLTGGPTQRGGGDPGTPPPTTPPPSSPPPATNSPSPSPSTPPTSTSPSPSAPPTSSPSESASPSSSPSTGPTG